MKKTHDDRSLNVFFFLFGQRISIIYIINYPVCPRIGIILYKFFFIQYICIYFFLQDVIYDIIHTHGYICICLAMTI